MKMQASRRNQRCFCAPGSILGLPDLSLSKSSVYVHTVHKKLQLRLTVIVVHSPLQISCLSGTRVRSQDTITRGVYGTRAKHEAKKRDYNERPIHVISGAIGRTST